MAAVTIAHKPELTVKEAVAAFRSHFGDRYEVYEKGHGKMPPLGPPFGLPNDFAVKKSEWVAVGVQLKQGRNKTSFVFASFVPAFLPAGIIAAFLIGPALLPFRFVLMFAANPLHNEVKAFMNEAEEFK